MEMKLDLVLNQTRFNSSWKWPEPKVFETQWTDLKTIWKVPLETH
jgi:hypothetical protein